MSVLVSYIPTPEGWAAYELALAEARLRNTSLLVLNVIVAGNAADVTAADEKDLDNVRVALREEGIEHEVIQAAEGDDAASAVLRVADERSVELIVVGLRRRSPVRMALLGSNAQHIILSAQCPVLSIRPA